MSRIAYLVSEYHAPSHTFVRREVEALRACGMEIVPFSIRSSTGHAEEVKCLLGHSPLAYAKALAVMAFRHPARLLSGWRLSLRHRPPGLRGLLWSQFHFMEAVLFARLLKQAGCDRLHNHFANSGATVGMLAAEIAGIGWSFTVHGISETDFPAGLLLPEKIERADFVACASYFMRAQAMRVVSPDHWPKMAVIRCGIDLDKVPPRSAPAASQNALRLLCVGRLSPEKGYFGLLDALAGLSGASVPFHLTIVGDGPSGEAIRQHVTQLELGDHISFTGALPEAETLEQVARCDLFVLPSLMEGLPVVLVEALALGKPALASHVAGIPELVIDGETGLLFTPGDWDDLARQLRRLMSDARLRERLGAAGRSMVEREFRIGQAAALLREQFLRPVK